MFINNCESIVCMIVYRTVIIKLDPKLVALTYIHVTKKPLVEVCYHESLSLTKSANMATEGLHRH